MEFDLESAEIVKEKEGPKFNLDSAEPVMEERFEDKSAVERAARGSYGALEVLGLMTAGTLKEAVAGALGVADLAYTAIRGDDDPLGAAVETINEVRGGGPDLSPITEGGKYLMGELEKPFAALNEFAKEKGMEVLPVAGPEVATAVETAIVSSPSAIGMRRAPKQMQQRGSDIRSVRSEAQETGVRTDGTIGEQAVSVTEAAADAAGGQSVKGQNMNSVQARVIQARKDTKKEVSSMYKEAKKTKAAVPTEAVSLFARRTRTKLEEDFDLEDMPRLAKRVEELAAIERLPRNSKIMLSALSAFRARLNRNPAPKSDDAQATGIGILRAELDSFIDGMFNADMISGNPVAVQRWKDARSAYAEYAKTFKDNRVVNQLATQAATPEEVANWIFGASAVGAKKQSAAVVAKLKQILGKDSPEFSAIRQEAVFDVVEPLLRDTPDFKAFGKNYERMARSNPTLLKELFEDSRPAMETLYKHSQALQKSAGAKINFDLNQALSQAAFGHSIARAGLKVRLAKTAIALIRRSVEGSDKRRVMSELLGYDVGATAIPPEALLYSGSVAAERE